MLRFQIRSIDHGNFSGAQMRIATAVHHRDEHAPLRDVSYHLRRPVFFRSLGFAPHDAAPALMLLIRAGPLAGSSASVGAAAADMGGIVAPASTALPAATPAAVYRKPRGVETLEPLAVPLV
jgi:hypothetical protein